MGKTLPSSLRKSLRSAMRGLRGPVGPLHGSRDDRNPPLGVEKHQNERTLSAFLCSVILWVLLHDMCTMTAVSVPSVFRRA